MIAPTVGRIVWYHPGPYEPWKGETLAAIVTKVWSDACVNLAVFDPNGNIMPKTNVTLWQGDNDPPMAGAYCEWMPYQKGQAAKTWALQALQSHP